MIDIGLVFSENGLSERLDIAKYKHILHTQNNIPRSQLDEKKLEKFVNNCM